MWTLAIVLSVIFAVIGAFRWKRALESPLTAMERRNRKIFLRESIQRAPNRGRVDDRGLFDEDFYERDDLCTNPLFRDYSCNAFYDPFEDLFKDDDPFGAGW